MSATRTDPTRRTIEAYAAETERWQSSQDEATTGPDLEALTARGNAAFEAISGRDTAWHQQVHQNIIPYDADREREILDLYRLWLTPSGALLPEIDRSERAGSRVEGADTFRAHCQEILGLLTPDVDFFGPELARLEQEALDAHRLGATAPFEEMGD